MTEKSFRRALTHELVVVPCLLGIGLPIHIIYALILGPDNENEAFQAVFFAVGILCLNAQEILSDYSTKKFAVRAAFNFLFFVFLAWIELWVLDVVLIYDLYTNMYPTSLEVLRFARAVLFLTVGTRSGLLSLRSLFSPMEEAFPTVLLLILGLTAYNGSWIPFSCILFIVMSYSCL